MVNLFLEEIEGYTAKGYAYASDLPKSLLEKLNIKRPLGIDLDVEIEFSAFTDNEGSFVDIKIEAVNLYKDMLGVRLNRKQYNHDSVVEYIVENVNIQDIIYDSEVAGADALYDSLKDEGQLQ